MTRFENIHIIANSKDSISVNANGDTAQVAIRIGDVYQSVCITFGLEHIPQIEQLLNLLWAMKDEQEAKVRQQLQAMEQEWSNTQDLVHLTADEF